MLSQTILDMIRAKYGKKTIYSADCAPLAKEIGLGEATLKRMFGLVGMPERNRVPHKSTMDILAEWLGFQDYDDLMKAIGEGDGSSEFTSLQTIEASKLNLGTQIQLMYDPERIIVMTYLGDEEFLVNETKNSKLIQGDRVKLTHLVLGQEMIVSQVIRDGRNLGGYRGAKDGGLTSLEIIV